MTREYRKDPEAISRLSAQQRRVTQEAATEPAFRNEYWATKEAGIYVDVVSGEPLFASTSKYDSHTGWPSFTVPLEPDNVVERTDTSDGMVRTFEWSDRSTIDFERVRRIMLENRIVTFNGTGFDVPLIFYAISGASLAGLYHESDYVTLWKSDPIPNGPFAVRGDLDPGFKTRLAKVLQTLDISSMSPEDMKFLGRAKSRAFAAVDDRAYDGIRDVVNVLHLNLSQMKE